MWEPVKIHIRPWFVANYSNLSWMDCTDNVTIYRTGLNFDRYTSTHLPSVMFMYRATAPFGDAQPMAMLSFPFLNLEGMTKEQKHHLLWSSPKASQWIWFTSFKAFYRLRQILDGTMHICEDYYLSPGPLPPAYKDLNLVDSYQDFKILKSNGHYCSFFNYRMLERIIINLGTRQY